MRFLPTANSSDVALPWRAKGIMECGSEASAHAEAGASALQRVGRAAPLSHSVGEGLGVRAKKRVCTLIRAGEWERAAGRTAVRPYTPCRQRGRGGLWSAEAKLPPTTQQTQAMYACQGTPSPRALKGVGFFSRGWHGGRTPAFPASRVLGARASRSHGGRDALLGNAASRHARKKTYPFEPRGRGGLGWGRNLSTLGH